MCEYSNCFTSISTLDILNFFLLKFKHFNGHIMACHYDFHFLFICLISLVICMLLSFSVFYCIDCFFSFEFESSLYFLTQNFLTDICFANILCQIMVCVFIVLTVYFEKKMYQFVWNPIWYFFFYGSCFMSKKSLPNSGPPMFPSMF